MALPTDRPIGDHEPIRLRDAARLMFPDGSVGEKALRRQRDAGTLVCSRIGGNDYTTMEAMRVMLERTRVAPKARKRVEAHYPRAASIDPAIALAAELAKVRERPEPARPHGKQPRKLPPHLPRPKTRKCQLSPRIPKPVPSGP